MQFPAGNTATPAPGERSDDAAVPIMFKRHAAPATLAAPELLQPAGPASVRPPAPVADVQAWLAKLPEKVRAPLLAAAYPRIAERLALFDSDPAYAVHYLDQMMVDQRGDRQGFPVEVGRELLRLRTHYGQHMTQSAAPNIEDGWGGHTVRPREKR